MKKNIKFSKFDVNYYFDFYSEYINLDYYKAEKFFNSLNKLSKQCLFVIQECYIKNLSDHPYFNWHIAFYLRKKFYNFKKSLLRS
ncbi:MAG: hypothetical protein E7183_07765 [Erysipelotrichaceae bacterium]|nr:hypothetical protein [Erysipelotrichaceae bacterium]